MRNRKGFAWAGTLCVALSACAGQGSQRATHELPPPFGGPETEIVFSYQVTVVPPVGVPDWQDRKIASLPSVRLAKLDRSGAVPAKLRDMLADRDSPEIIRLPEISATGYLTQRAAPGWYAFVGVVDFGQSSGQGLTCLDYNGRPLDPSAIIVLATGATVYAGHISMEIALRPTADPTLLEASFRTLVAMPVAPDENFAAMHVDPKAIIRQPAALTSCEPWVFGDLVGRVAQCSGALRAQLEAEAIPLRGNRSMDRETSKRLGIKIPVRLNQVLNCPN